MIWSAAMAGARHRATVIPLLLDTLAVTVKGAWEVRKLRAAYAGPCMRVRRALDNLEADIGFTGSGDLDVAGILAHCGSGSGYVSKLYDQSLAMQDLAQTVASSQPRIALNGVVDRLATSANRPALVGITPNTFLSNSSFQLGGTVYAAFGIVSLTGNQGPYARALIYKGQGDDRDYNGNNSVVFATTGGGGIAAQKNGNGLAFQSIPNGAFAYSSVWDSNGVTFGINGATSTAITATSIGATGLLVWGSSDAGVTGAEVWDGMISAHIVTSGTLSNADNAAIRASQKSYYGTP